MKLSKDQILHLAKLARLEISENRIDSMTNEVGSILEYVESIQKIDTRDVRPFTMPAKSQGFRHDEAFESDDVTRDYILANFPEHAQDLLAAPGVFENPKT